MSNNLSEKVFRIFVSSVGIMMDEERTTLRERIWKSGHIPIAMEGFSGNHGQTSIEIVKDNLDHADVIIFVLGFTYGSIIGESLACKNCPIKGSCNAKKRKYGNCIISYTHFEYLYAKQKNILSYCIRQKDINDTDAFRKRVDTFVQKNIDDNKKSDTCNMLLSEYFSNKEMYGKFLSKIRTNWSNFYDANDSTNICVNIADIFSDIEKQFIKNGENLSGLVDGNQVKKELIEKNRQIERLNREMEQFRTIRSEIDEIKQNQLSFLPSTAVTGTCIPFYYNKEEKIITTYLVCNSAYSNGNRIMFPGGHAFVNDDPPETVAIMKARIEAGLDVNLIDLYSCFNNQDNEFSSHFTIYRPPHYTYLFEEDGSAKCYKEKNHLKHYDLVYVCEIKKEGVHPATECTQIRIAVDLPDTQLTLTQVKEKIEEGVLQYNLQSKITENESFENYFAKILTDAHADYIRFLQRSEV